ncbi:DBR1-domain-containing protein [Moesziomyces antarcticus]|uniref:Related to lariat-debranching enzyme n=1 Tax=Pseudozyma antarctica TaxID=84753 RepID=A0A5C3FGS9_PSEA2|nr:DBR1-domain-containing protein [Moesziomyces antarcticus]GAK62910.1 DBR1-domain-containing protein [Moesziomyces antarcticus]SPO43614.1 related to lariat-debranching enzyme [Moesziomyces antarcticus]
MKLAIQGCSHGELDAIYASVLRIERERFIHIDALLLCGDFQAVRNRADLHALSVPPKYRQLGEFHAYYAGHKIAPVLTLVIGGNHEASNYMHELYHGGWLAPNIYFLGAAGAVELNGLLVAGISGIYKSQDYAKGRYERLPYDAGSLRSCYHTREFDVLRLSALATDKVDVVMSHDWPNTIEQWGDTQTLVRKKPFFEKEISTQSLGSPPLMQLLQQLKPAFWFSAHLHVKFAAIYPHGRTAAAGTQEAKSSGIANPEALDIDLDFDEDPAAGDTARVEDKSASVMDSASGSDVTRFLALHKCLSHTPFLQVIEHASPLDDELAARKAALNNEQRIMPRLRFSRRWLAITRAFHPHLSLSYRQLPLPDPTQPEFAARIQAELRAVDEHLASLAPRAGKRKLDQDEASDDPLDVFGVQRFVRTAPALHEPGGDATGQPAWYTNPQTEQFCALAGIPNKINPRPYQPSPMPNFVPPPPLSHPPQEWIDPNAVAIDMDDFDTDTPEADGLLRLDDDESQTRWKEGTG